MVQVGHYKDRVGPITPFLGDPSAHSSHQPLHAHGASSSHPHTVSSPSRRRPPSEEIAMGYCASVGRYRLGRMIGEGSFAKVRLAVNTETGGSAAVKIIDKKMVMKNKLMSQVKQEISTMKLLHHPSIVKIYEVLATKTKIYLVMEYISGGQLSDKLAYLQRLEEREARRYFQQLVDAVDYCHGRGIYHRDLKPENLLIDRKGNLKVSDFGFSVLRKSGDLLSTACGSPSYVAPEVIVHKNYEGAAADVWSCGVILFELLAGHLPFEDSNLPNLFRKSSRAEYTFPDWFTAPQKKLISRMLDPSPIKRATIAEIFEDEWFRIDYEPSSGIEDDMSDPEVENSTIDSMEEISTPTARERSQSFINAFQLIAMSNYLDLSGLFQLLIPVSQFLKDNDNQKMKLGSKHSIDETIEKIEMAAKGVSLSVERTNSKVKLHENRRLTRSRSHSILSAEVIEVTPTHCVVEVSKYAGEIRVYKEFCRSLSCVLKNSSSTSDLLASNAEERTNGEGSIRFTSIQC